MHSLPFAQPGRFWKGNLHTHCTASDGRYELSETCRRYREAGYDFVSITDHFLPRYDFPLTDTRPYRSTALRLSSAPSCTPSLKRPSWGASGTSWL